MNVRTFGLMRESASQRTMVSSSTPQARPNAEVQDALMEEPPKFPLLAQKAREKWGTRPWSARFWSAQVPLRARLFWFVRRYFVVDGGQLQDFELAFAVGRIHDHFIADFLVEQGAANGGSGRNFSGRDVGFLAGDDLIFHLLILGIVVHLYRGTEANSVLGDVVHVDHGEVGEALAELADARLDELLALLGHVIFGVFAEVAEGGSLLDFLGKLVNQLVFERVDLFLQFSFDLIGHEMRRRGLRLGLRYYTPGCGWSRGLRGAS